MKYLLNLLFLFLLLFSNNFKINAQENIKWVTAKNGEGINSLLLRNNLSPNEYVEEFKKLNAGRLTPNGQLVLGRKYKLPMLYPVHDYPLFGDKWARVEQTDDLLKGSLYYLVSGHGGPDPGATGKISGHTVTEDEYAYDIVLRLARNLISHGAIVKLIIQDPDDGIRDDQYLTPDKDEVCYPQQQIPTQQTKRLHQRAAAINILYKKNRNVSYQRLLVVHLDARSKKNRTDVFFYHHSESKSGKNLANHLQSTMKEKYAQFQPNRDYTGSVSTRRLYMLQTTLPPSTFVELGNIHNYRDQLRFIKPENRQAVADWLCDGLMDDFREYKSSSRK